MNNVKIEQALGKMKEAGFKYTERRKAMLNLLDKEDKYISAKDVYDFMNREYEGISYDTIYRNLKDFTELNILEETDFNGEKKFRFQCEQIGNHHHHHFICTICGATEPIKMCPMNFFEEQLEGVKIEGHRFEIFGICKNCQKIKKTKIANIS